MPRVRWTRFAPISRGCTAPKELRRIFTPGIFIWNGYCGFTPAAVLLHWARWRFLKLAVGVLLLAGTGQLACQAWRAAIVCFQPSDHPFPDPCNPYVYAQTSRDILKLVTKLNDLARVSPQGQQMLVKVMAPDSDYWPLPWYLRGFDQIGWW